jgi:Protein of unknown function (DUF1571)/LysM domain
LIASSGPWCHAQATAAPAEPHAMVQNILRSIDGLVTVSGRVKRTERVNGTMEQGDLRFKVNAKPFKVYIFNIDPHEGTELLYVDGWNDGKAYIHPNQFPWVSISMDSYGSTMLKDQHHHVTSTGFGTVRKVLRWVTGRPAEENKKRIVYVGKEKWYGKMVDVIKIINTDYQITKYTVQAGEDLLKIDAKLAVPSYKLLELNPEVDDYFDVKAGQVIKVPSHYGKEIVLMVDPDTHLPVVQAFFDDKGLFEKYEYSEIKVNPRFSTLDFSEDNEAYGF